MPNLSDRSVVITGASSGIGRATALAFSRAGAKVTLVSRRGKELSRLAKLCLRRGAGGALVAEADVTDPAALRRAANAAIRQFGRVDMWVNNAGVGAVGNFTETPLAAHTQVINTNLVGYLNGAYAVLPHFEKRRQGTLVNVISFGAFVATPFAASYAASKYGLRGLGESLRAELSGTPDIHICDVHPGVVDTPGFLHGANYTGQALRPRAPDQPEDVADAIVRLATHPREVTSVGAIAKLAPVGYALAPRLARWVIARTMQAGLARSDAASKGPGTVFSAATTGPAARARLHGPAVKGNAPVMAPSRRSVEQSEGGGTVARALGLGLVVAAVAAVIGGRKAS